MWRRGDDARARLSLQAEGGELGARLRSSGVPSRQHPGAREHAQPCTEQLVQASRRSTRPASRPGPPSTSMSWPEQRAAVAVAGASPARAAGRLAASASLRSVEGSIPEKVQAGGSRARTPRAPGEARAGPARTARPPALEVASFDAIGFLCSQASRTSARPRAGSAAFPAAPVSSPRRGRAASRLSCSQARSTSATARSIRACPCPESKSSASTAHPLGGARYRPAPQRRPRTRSCGSRAPASTPGRARRRRPGCRRASSRERDGGALVALRADAVEQHQRLARQPRPTFFAHTTENSENARAGPGDALPFRYTTRRRAARGSPPSQLSPEQLDRALHVAPAPPWPKGSGAEPAHRARGAGGARRLKMASARAGPGRTAAVVEARPVAQSLAVPSLQARSNSRTARGRLAAVRARS
jgi:hypothetical protein